MNIQYYLSDGQEINWFSTGGNDTPSLYDVDQIALMYARLRPNRLPTTVYCSIRMYADFMKQFGALHNAFVTPANVPTKVQVHTSAGILEVKCMPMASDAKLFLVGCDDDFERYDIDKIFEETVLKDCERE